MARFSLLTRSLTIGTALAILPACVSGQAELTTENPPTPNTETASAPPFQAYWAVIDRRAQGATVPPPLPLDETSLNHNVAILYEGFFSRMPKAGPHLVDSQADMDAFLQQVREVVAQKIPDPSFDGCAIIDFESWHPHWPEPQNRPTDNAVLNAWIDYMRTQRPTELVGLRGQSLENKLAETYDEVAKRFFLGFLEAAKSVRPNAKWGYFGFPNQVQSGYMQDPPTFWTLRNDRIHWLYEAQGALYPVLYNIFKSVPDNVQVQHTYEKNQWFNSRLVLTNMQEAQRVAQGKPIYPFVWIRYHDAHPEINNTFLNDFDLNNTFARPKELGASGLILWDVVIPESYVRTRDYMNQRLNPMLRTLVESSTGTRSLNQTSPPPDSTPAPAMLRATRVDVNASSGNTSSANASPANANPATRAHRRDLRADRRISASNLTAAEVRAAIRRANRP